MENQREIKKLAAEFKALIAGGRNVLDPWCYYFKRRISRRNFVLRHDYTSMFARLLASPECIADLKIKHDPQTNIVTFLGTEEMSQDASKATLTCWASLLAVCMTKLVQSSLGQSPEILPRVCLMQALPKGSAVAAR